MVPDEALDGRPVVPEPLGELLCGHMVGRFADDVAILLKRRLVRDWPAVVEREGDDRGWTQIGLMSVSIRGMGRG